MSKLAKCVNSVGVQDQKAKNKSEIGWKPLKLAYFDLILPLRGKPPLKYEKIKFSVFHIKLVFDIVTLISKNGNYQMTAR